MTSREYIPSPWYVLFGLGFIWSPPFGTVEATVFPELFGNLEALFISRILLISSFGLACLFVFFLAKQLSYLREKRLLVISSGIMTATGMLLGCLPSLIGEGVIPALYIGAVFRGFGLSILILAWVESFLSLSARSVAIAVSAALVVYGVIGVAIAQVERISPFAATLMLTAAPLLCCLGCLQVAGEERLPSRSMMVSQPMTRRMTILFAGNNLLYGFIFGIMLAYYAVLATPTLAAVFAGVSFIIGSIFSFSKMPINLSFGFRVYVIVVAFLLGIIMVFFQQISWLAAALLAGLWATQIFFTIIIFIDAEMGPSNAPSASGAFALCVASIGLLIATVLIPPSEVTDLNSLPLLVATFIGVLLLAVVFLPSGHTWVRAWGFSSFLKPETREMLVTRRCGEITAEYRLTTREYEILLLLAQGHGRESISEMLFISPYTAKTHIRNLYAKLKVHSVEELLLLIEEDNPGV